jgi:hypothetical protein
MHENHWTEPKVMTEARDSDEVFCEFCGEEIPWHNNSCRLLKTAYKNRVTKCNWCEEKHVVGIDMYQHTTTAHEQEILNSDIIVKVNQIK